jgi:Cu2+-exporting ATPase
LVRDRRGLEDARLIDAVVFDKTGTLTRGEFGVVNITIADTLSADEALRFAAAVERDSEHTIAQGIVRSAEERKLLIPVAHNFEAIPGKGVRANLDGREFLIGGPALLQAFEHHSSGIASAGRIRGKRSRAVGDLLDRTSQGGCGLCGC